MAPKATSSRARAPKPAAHPKRPTDPLLPFSERGGKLMTKDEGANYLGVTRRMVQHLLDDGRLRKTKIGKVIRIHVDDLDALIEQQRGEA